MFSHKKKPQSTIFQSKKSLDDLAWQVNNCEEAAKVFEEMDQCPVCGERAFLNPKTGEFIVLHKNRKFIIN